MSRTRRNFSAKFKSELVIELLKGEKDLNTIASENNIQPNLLRNWKKEFLDKASVVFGRICPNWTRNGHNPHGHIQKQLYYALWKLPVSWGEAAESSL